MVRGAPQKSWAELGSKRRKQLLTEWLEEIKPYVHSGKDCGLVVDAISSELGTIHGLGRRSKEEDGKCERLLSQLGALRQGVPKTHALNKPSISVSQLDSAVQEVGMNMDELRKCQYPISKRSLKSFASTSAPSKKPGRKTKVHNQSLIDLVKQQLQQYVKESERVVVIGRGTSRKMALAQHLTKKRYRIYMEEPSLHRAMSWTVFHRILKLHFPYVRNPRRRTDVCSHCKHLETGLLPKALRAMDKNRKQLTAIWPDYFRAFDASTVVQGKKKDPDKFPFLARFVSYVNRQNFDAMNNSERQQALTGSEKLSLHMAPPQFTR